MVHAVTHAWEREDRGIIPCRRLCLMMPETSWQTATPAMGLFHLLRRLLWQPAAAREAAGWRGQ